LKNHQLLGFLHFQILRTTQLVTETIQTINTAAYVLYLLSATHIKGKAVPRGFQKVKVPIFHDNGTGWW